MARIRVFRPGYYKKLILPYSFPLRLSHSEVTALNRIEFINPSLKTLKLTYRSFIVIQVLNAG